MRSCRDHLYLLKRGDRGGLCKKWKDNKKLPQHLIYVASKHQHLKQIVLALKVIDRRLKNNGR